MPGSGKGVNMATNKSKKAEKELEKEDSVKLEEPEKEETVKADQPEEEERVMVMVPYIEGQDPEVTVIINGEVTKFKKGVMVSVKRSVAEVIANSNQQMMLAYKNQEKFREQRTDL